MRILLIASLFRPYVRGGAEVVMHSIADELKKTHEVIVLTTRTWNGFRSLLPQKSVEDGISVYRYYPCNIFSFATIEDGKPIFIRCIWHLFAFLNFHSYLVARAVIAKEKPDRIFTHNLTGIGFLVPAAIRHACVAWTHTVHDVQLAIPGGVLLASKQSSRRAFVDRISSALTRAFMGSPAHVVFPSQFLFDFYNDRKFFIRSKKYLFPNPVPDIALFSRAEYEEALHSRLASRARGEIVCIYLGLLKAHKGLLDLVAAFARLEEQGARLIIGGTGPLHATLDQAAQNDSRITLLGYVTRADIRSLYTQGHVTVVPSLLCENSPMVIQESFAAGIPVIAARSGGAAERIREGENGFSYPPGDVTLLAHALDRVVKLTNKQYETMSMRAFQTVQEDTAERYCKKLVTL